jgi:L-aspartate oxidase
MTKRETFDGVLILGAGLAGLSAALACAPRKALVIAPEPITQGCSSAWAQGGMAAALSPDDNPQRHAADTIAAGAGLVDAEMANFLTREGPAAVRRLAALGAPFDREADGAFVLSLEAAHSRPRVARVKGDQAGKAIMQSVAGAVQACPTIDLRQGRALALLKDEAHRVRGALIERPDGRRVEIIAPAVILATGGLGGLYAITTVPGARIADPEFVQFHPTAIAIDADPVPLASEALRGEGAKLIDAKGEPFMARYHAQGDLAPRDVVARAIHRQIMAGEGAFLDARQAIGEHFPEEFPGVFAACMAAGLDPRVQPIPVAPAAHYHMGGVMTDKDGRASLPGLYAVGECASTGVHGANRLASNSLLEAAVFGTRAGLAARSERDPGTEPLAAHVAPELPRDAFQALRQAMTRDAGVVRDRAGLEHLLLHIETLSQSHGDALALVAARLVAQGALARQESRGAHYRPDFPCMASPARRTILTLAQLERQRANAEPAA